MSEASKLADFIHTFCEAHSLHVEDSSNGRFRIFTDSASGITLFLEIKSPNDIYFYYLERTYDILYHGDRTDVHVIISLMFASFLREFNYEISCSLFDIPHPAVPDEIWGRYIMPEQAPLLWNIKNWDDLVEVVTILISGLTIWREFFWQFAGCPCQECLKKHKVEDANRYYDIPLEINHSKNKLLKATSRLNYGNRIRPDWSYFYDIKNEITVIKSETLAFLLESIKQLSKKDYEIVEGVKGKFLIQGELKNYLSNQNFNEFKKLFRSLGLNIAVGELKLFPLENMVISVSRPYIIALGRSCGIHKFKNEREKLRIRHNRESKLLFPVALFEWNEQAFPEQFENMIKALLEREPNVVTARIASPLNQGDKGRDIMIEWKIRNASIVSEAQPPTSLIKVVGQCKLSNKSIGKTKVLDIRDTVESHNAQGYFLAVSTQISAPLTQKLEELKLKGIWTEWWNRDDIENRLSKNIDLLPLFSNVVKAKHQVKFVEKDY